MMYYPWFDELYKKIISSFKNKKGHHAILVYSQPGNGEVQLFYAISYWLMCSKPVDAMGCGLCKNCYLMKHGNHPDFYKFELNDKKETFGIDIVRNIISYAYTHSSYSNIKIIFIADVNNLTEYAVNALLKTIEEPPRNTYFFMTCSISENLLSTFKSRCLSWLLKTPDEKLGLSWLKSIGYSNIETAITALRLYNCAPIMASNFLKPFFWNKRLKLYKKLSDVLIHGNFLNLLSELNTDNIDQSLYWLNSILVDAIKFQQKLENYIFNFDMRSLIQKISQIFKTENLYRCWQQYLDFLIQYKDQEMIDVNVKFLLIDYLLSLENNICK